MYNIFLNNIKAARKLKTQKNMTDLQKKLNTLTQESKESTDKNMSQLNQTIINSSTNNNSSSEENIPDEIGSASILFKNKSWGMS